MIDINIPEIIEKALKNTITYPKTKIETQEEFEKVLRIVSANISLFFNETEKGKIFTVKELHDIYRWIWAQVWDNLENHV